MPGCCKDASTAAAFAADLQVHGGDPEVVTEVSIGMTNAFTKGMAASLPCAKFTFDKFHVVSLVNNAIDEVRRLEPKDHFELVGCPYVCRKNPENLTPGQRETFDALDIVNCHLLTARAYQIRLTFQDLFNQPADKAKSILDQWCFRATHSSIPAIVEVAKNIRRHQDGILRWFTSGI